MATFVTGGIAGYRAKNYGRADKSAIDYINRSRENFSRGLTDYGRQLNERSERLYQRYDDSKVVRLIRAASRKVDNWHRPMGISLLSQIGHFQHANEIMRRIVMANPNVRSAYHRQECVGYGDAYFDREPGRIGIDHYDYRRFTSGMMMDRPDGTTASITWYEEPMDNEHDVLFEEKSDALLTWSILDQMFVKGADDPTDPFNSSL